MGEIVEKLGPRQILEDAIQMGVQSGVTNADTFASVVDNYLAVSGFKIIDVDDLEAQLAERDSTIERLRDGHEQIIQWSEAYPIDVFPEPDLKKAHKILKAAGMGLDAISASNMRHVTKQAAEISRLVLDGSG